jgi:hypothetical protein
MSPPSESLYRQIIDLPRNLSYQSHLSCCCVFKRLFISLDLSHLS